VPLLCSATENDTNEGPSYYLSPSNVPLMTFFPLCSPIVVIFLVTLVVFALLCSLLGRGSIYEAHFQKFQLLKHWKAVQIILCSFLLFATLID
jgi:uncharacterized membrane protein YfhO